MISCRYTCGRLLRAYNRIVVRIYFTTNSQEKQHSITHKIKLLVFSSLHKNPLVFIYFDQKFLAFG